MGLRRRDKFLLILALILVVSACTPTSSSDGEGSADGMSEGTGDGASEGDADGTIEGSVDGDPIIIEGWTCAVAVYDDSATCDCGCGIQDPDCANRYDLSCTTSHCAAAQEVLASNNAQCITAGTNPSPAEWTCYVGYYGADDGCDCGCGVIDVDCADTEASSCDVIHCDFAAQVEVHDNGTCDVRLQPPPQWTCPASAYDDGESCDCGCGALDVDCANATAASCNAVRCGDAAPYININSPIQCTSALPAVCSGTSALGTCTDGGDSVQFCDWNGQAGQYEVDGYACPGEQTCGTYRPGSPRNGCRLPEGANCTATPVCAGGTACTFDVVTGQGACVATAEMCSFDALFSCHGDLLQRGCNFPSSNDADDGQPIYLDCASYTDSVCLEEYPVCIVPFGHLCLPGLVGCGSTIDNAVICPESGVCPASG